ncbi:MAG: acyl carrier protein [Pseudomonadales bacterium]|nr:acyl carrier protein [Pseudomonadales bacterium]
MTEITATIETLRDLVRAVKQDPPAELGADSDMVDTLGLSSVDVMELIGLVEDTWDIAFPLNDLASIRTLRQLAARVIEIRANA